MKVMGLVGWSGSGKTTLILKLLPVLAGRGLRVSTMKHAHHAFDIDKPGKDSFEHRRAGATEVLVSSGNRWALMHELRGSPEPPLEALLARMSPVDLVLIEGYKSHGHDKIEVFRDVVPGDALWRRDPSVVAVATTSEAAGEIGRRVLDLDDPAAVADFIVSHCGLRREAPAL